MENGWFKTVNNQNQAIQFSFTLSEYTIHALLSLQNVNSTVRVFACMTWEK